MRSPSIRMPWSAFGASDTPSMRRPARTRVRWGGAGWAAMPDPGSATATARPRARRVRHERGAIIPPGVSWEVRNVRRPILSAGLLVRQRARFRPLIVFALASAGSRRSLATPASKQASQSLVSAAARRAGRCGSAWAGMTAGQQARAKTMSGRKRARWRTRRPADRMGRRTLRTSHETPGGMMSPRSCRTLRALGLAVAVALPGSGIAAQPAPPHRTLVRAGRLIDGVSEAPKADQGILIEGKRIVLVGPWAAVQGRAAGAERVDLSTMTVLPGLIDVHTHVLLNGDITAQDYDDQLLKESIPYRAIRATANARMALWNGFTTLRDVETEGAMYADADLKRAIARGVVPGPRMFVSTRAMAPTGMYPLTGYSWELRVPEGVQIVDGPEEIRKAVREQVKYGADWIKFYADRAYYLGEDGRLRSRVNFTDEEAKALVDETHRLGRKVAAHAMGWDGIDAALRAGVNSIEHGPGLTPDLVERLVRQRTYWCPTLYVMRYVAEGRGGIWLRMPDLAKRAVQAALRGGALDLIAFGTGKIGRR